MRPHVFVIIADTLTTVENITLIHNAAKMLRHLVAHHGVVATVVHCLGFSR